MYGSLQLIEGVGQAGRARSAWQLSKLMLKLGQQDKAESFVKEAIQIRENMGHKHSDNVSQKDFDNLIGIFDQ